MDRARALSLCGYSAIGICCGTADLRSVLNPATRSLSPLDNGHTALKAPGGGCLEQSGAGFEGGAGGLIIAVCNATSPAQTFAYDTTTLQLKQVSSGHCVDVHASGPIVWM